MPVVQGILSYFYNYLPKHFTMRSHFLCILSLLFCLNLNAQNAKTAYVELGGPGLMSANFDMRFSKEPGGFGGRIGIGGFSINDFEDRVSLLTVPVGINYLLGKDGKNYFEVGAGFTYMHVGARNDTESSTLESSFGNLTFGYRPVSYTHLDVYKRQKMPLEHLLISITFTPFSNKCVTKTVAQTMETNCF